MTDRRVAFAVPGDLTTLTGGYIYDRRLMAELRALDWQVDHIALPGSFPAPPEADMARAFAQLADVPEGVPLIVDGLAYGALDPDRIGQIRAPIVALVHHPLAKETGLSQMESAALHATERHTLASAAHVLVPSPHTGQILTAEYGVPTERITIASPGIDRPTTAPAPIDPPLILSVGIQLPRKGHDVLLRALAQVVDLPWRAVIAGGAFDAGHATELETLRQTLGLSDRVHMAGRVPQDVLAGLYGQASLFALATRYEGYGIVFDEALVHGLPILSCAAGAVPDTVPEAAGILVPPDDPDAFAGALRRLLANPSDRARLAAGAQAAGAKLPGWEDTAARVAGALDKVLGR